MQKRFLTTFLVALVTATVITSAMYWGLTAGLLRVNRDFQSKLNYMVLGTDHYNVVFTGASRVHNGINPNLFDSLTHVNSYNAGIEGASIAETAVFIKKYIKSHGAPQYLFLGLEENVLGTDSVWDFPRFFPYTSDPDVFNLYIYQPQILSSRYLPPLALTYYDDSRKSLGIEGFLRNPGKYAYSDTKGYQTVPYQPKPGLVAEYMDGYRYSKDGLKILNGICELCKQQDIRLIFILPPKLITNKLVGARFDKSFAGVDAIAKVNNVPVFDFSHKKEFTDPNLFYDGRHLIVKGADLYTTMIAGEFNKMR